MRSPKKRLVTIGLPYISVKENEDTEPLVEIKVEELKFDC